MYVQQIGTIRHRLVPVTRVILTLCQADAAVPMATYSPHIDLCGANVR